MKRMNKLSAGILTVSLLAVSIVHAASAAPADSSKYSLTESKITGAEPSLRSKSNKPVWDKSTLKFTGQTGTSEGISATVINVGSQMEGEVIYEVYWTEKGNPKNGVMVDSGVIKPLSPGASVELVYNPDLLPPGEYMFKSYQRTGHPGTGELWSSSLTVLDHDDDTKETLQPERPFDQFFNSNVEGGTAVFTVPEGMGKVEISFSSYVYPEGVVPQEDGQPYEGQKVYENVTKSYGPGTHTVEVGLPEGGYWQTDLYLGPVIEALTADGHPMDKIIDADFGFANP